MAALSKQLPANWVRGPISGQTVGLNQERNLQHGSSPDIQRKNAFQQQESGLYYSTSDLCKSGMLVVTLG